MTNNETPRENLRFHDTPHIHHKPPIEPFIKTFFEIKSGYDFNLVEKILDLLVLNSETDTNTYRTLILQQRAYYLKNQQGKGVN